MRAILDTGVVLPTDIDGLPGELAVSAVTLARCIGVLVAREQHTRAERLRRLSILQHDSTRCPSTKPLP